MNKQKSTYLLVVIFSVFFLFAANKIATNEYPFLRSEEADSLLKLPSFRFNPSTAALHIQQIHLLFRQNF